MPATVHRHAHMLRIVLVVAVVLVASSLVLQVTYGRWLLRTADALVLKSPVISYRYNGVYEGTARVGHVAAKVRVTIGPRGITSVEFLQRPFGNMDLLVDRILKASGVPVDAITGATVSSKVVMKAVDNALMKQHP